MRDACWALAHDVVNGKLDETEFRSRIADMATTCVPALDKLDVENCIESALRKVREETGRKDKPDASPSFTLPDFEPADEPAPIAGILSDIANVIVDYVAIDSHQGNACALWIMHCHCLTATDYTPRLLITSPTRRCGKTTLLRVIAKLVPRPLFLSGVTAAMLFRSIGDHRPVLLVDEADNAGLKHNEDLRIVFNEGVFAEAVIGRTVGDSHEPKMFPIFAPAALAGIGSHAGNADGPLDHHPHAPEIAIGDEDTLRPPQCRSLGRARPPGGTVRDRKRCRACRSRSKGPEGAQRSRARRLEAIAGDRRHGR